MVQGITGEENVFKRDHFGQRFFEGRQGEPLVLVVAEKTPGLRVVGLPRQAVRAFGGHAELALPAMSR
jgi:hypothetical protein